MPELLEQLLIVGDTETPQDEAFDSFPHGVAAFIDKQTEVHILQTLVYNVQRTPKNLHAHVKRIYFCYRNKLSEQLYAALVDLLVILAGKGQAIAKRLVNGSRNCVTPERFVILKNYLQHGSVDDWVSSPYSVFTPGWIGTATLVEYQEKSQVEHDYLVLANDFIEYCQLDEAMSALETGVNVQPERTEMQQMLLELYKSTKSISRFKNMYQEFNELSLPLIDEWQELERFFDGNPA